MPTPPAGHSLIRRCRSSTQMSHPRSAAGVRWMETTNARSGGIDAVRSSRPVSDTKCVMAMWGFVGGRITRLGARASRKYLAICSPYAGRLTDSLVITLCLRSHLPRLRAERHHCAVVARCRSHPKPYFVGHSVTREGKQRADSLERGMLRPPFGGGAVDRRES